MLKEINKTRNPHKYLNNVQKTGCVSLLDMIPYRCVRSNERTKYMFIIFSSFCL